MRKPLISKPRGMASTLHYSLHKSRLREIDYENVFIIQNITNQREEKNQLLSQ